MSGPSEKKYDKFYKDLPHSGFARKAMLRNVPVAKYQEPGLAALVSHSQNNLDTGKAVYHDDGSVSTIYSSVVHDKRLNKGAPTVIPTVWDGQILEGEDAIKQAVKAKKKWPYIKVEDKYKKEPWKDMMALDEAVALSKHAHALVSKQAPRK